MSTVRFIADLHFDHKNISRYSGSLRGGHDIESHNEWVVNQWNSVVMKKDLTFVLGDVSFTKSGISLVEKLNGNKQLVMGNHDEFPNTEYSKVFNKLHGFMKYKGFWLSHAPILESSLRGMYNVHGHTHSNVLINGKHICVSVEALYGKPISLEQIKELL